MVRLLQFAQYLSVRSMICVMQIIPLKQADNFAQFAAWLFADVFGVRRRVVMENLDHAFPEMTPKKRAKVARRMWRHLILMVAEVAHLSRRCHTTNWRDTAELVNTTGFLRCLLDDRPTIFVTAHLGNFELAGYVTGLLGFRPNSVARPLDNRYIDEFLLRFRGVTGQQMIPKKGGYERIEETLAQGDTLCLLADQYAGRKGCWVDFFGRPASTHKAIALLALQYEARIVVGAACRVGGPLDYEVRVSAIADPRDGGPIFENSRTLTQWYTSEIEKLVRRNPEQYWWLHRRWKDRRRKRAPARPAASAA